MAIYALGVGLTMPQAMASAMMPFPDRAGAASSLLGICQMTFAALLGIASGRRSGARPCRCHCVRWHGRLALVLSSRLGGRGGDRLPTRPFFR